MSWPGGPESPLSDGGAEGLPSPLQHIDLLLSPARSVDKDARWTFEESTLGGAAATFQLLLDQLKQEHERQLGELHGEIAQFRASAASSAAGPAVSAVFAPRESSLDPTSNESQTRTFNQPLRSQSSLRPVFVEKTPIGEIVNTSKNVGDNHLADIVHARRKSRLEQFTNGPLDLIAGICIVLSIVTLFIRSEYHGYVVGVELGFQDPSEWNWPHGIQRYLDTSQHVFATVFVLEMVFRVCAYRSKFFYINSRTQWFNIIDALVVCLMVLDQYILVALKASHEDNASLMFIQVCRLMKVLRTLRALRAFKVFHNLRALLLTVIASLSALFWSMVLLAILMLMAALILCQTLSNRFNDEDISEQTRAWLYRMYGTAGRSYYTVFELTFSGGWPNYARALVEDVHSGYAFFFIAYITLVTFATFRIITAIFIKDTLAAAANDTEMVIAEKMREKQLYAQKLTRFFRAVDTTGDGIITFSEFKASLVDPRIKMYLGHLEIDTQQSERLFAMMDDGDGFVSVEEFLDGALRIKGAARSQDILAISHDMRKLAKNFYSSMERLHIELRTMKHELSDMKVNSI